MVKQLSSVVLSACMLLTMSACAPLGQGIKSFDQSKIVLMQTEQMVAGEDIAVVETSQGDFKMRFFPSEAPKTVENFIQLAKSGYFDGQKISYIERQQEESGKCRLFAGSGKPLTEPGESIYDEPLEQEISYNLGTIPGAVVAYAPEGTVDSRFYISGTHPVSREEIEQLTASNYPSQLVELFEDYGGYPDRVAAPHSVCTSGRGDGRGGCHHLRRTRFRPRCGDRGGNFLCDHPEVRTATGG